METSGTVQRHGAVRPVSPRPATDSATVRGSGLLLAGRVIAVGLGFVAQVVLVRALAPADYGAFAWGLAVVSLGSSAAAFGLDKAMSRFLPMYEEAGDRRRAVGAVVLAVVLTGLISVAVIALLLLVGPRLVGTVDPTALALLAILAFLVPVQAFDALVTAVFAVLANPRAIFVRRHLLAPGLQLLVLAVVVPAGLGVTAIAVGYVAAGLLGVLLYGVLLVRLVRARWGDALGGRPPVPAGEVLRFSLPLLTSDLVFVLRGSLVVVLLEWYGSTLDVAAFRAVFPQARLILIVLTSFGYLFLPAASRLVARQDPDGLARLYGSGTAWVALLTFPLFAASFALAGPVAGLLYGQPYAASGPILAVLALGFFASAILGLAGQVLRALGHVRTIVAVDLATVAASVAAYFVLIPSLGALGAAIGTALTLAMQGVAYAVAAARAGVPLPRGRQLLVYPSLAATGLVLLVVQVLLAPPVWLGVLLVGVAGLALLRVHRGALDLAGTFPELGRLPLLGRLLVGNAATREVGA